jgi:hypothetical protein
LAFAGLPKSDNLLLVFSHFMVRQFSLTVVLFAISLLGGQEPQKTTPGSLTIQDVIRLSKENVSDDLIIAQVKHNAKAFDLNSDEIIELKKSGVSENVIKYLVDPNYSPPPLPPQSTPPPSNPLPPAPPPKPPSDLRALKVPPEPGIYYLTGEQEFLMLDLKPVVPKKTGKSLPPFKGHIIGSVIGPAAKTRAVGPSATFFFRLPEKAAIDDLALLSLSPSANRRDLDFGTKPGKPVFPVKAVGQFDPKEVAAGMFRLTVPVKGPGEYLFFVLGSGDDKKGLLGKGYDFGVDGSGRSKVKK